MEQFKTLEDLRLYTKELGKYYARPTIRGEHPTLYIDTSGDEVVMGIRRKDYLLSPCGQWVLPTEAMGLSFSSHWQHLKNAYRLKEGWNPGKAIDVYWVLEKADIPEGMKFVVDKNDNKKRHYFLCVTERMHISQLVQKLQWVADRLTVIKDASKAL